MKYKNLKIIDFYELKSKVLIVQNSFSKISIRERDKSFLIEMECNLNCDVNFIVGREYPKESITDFIPCIEAFGDRQFASYFDEHQNIGLEVGYDITRELEIFFELVDYSYDSSIGPKPTTYTICIDETDQSFRALKELIKFIRNQKEKERQGENSENRTYTVEYKRPSGL